MNSPTEDRFRQADALFDAALDLPEAERAAFVDRVSIHDDTLRAAVLRLLEAHRLSEGFLGQPAAEIGAPLVCLGDESIDASSYSFPHQIGPFRLIRPLGEGGMGAVFLAEREDAQFRQRVALKLVRGGIGSDYLVQRFLEERQILASLEHPHIARLLDGGITAEGLPYFAMEYVEGEPLDRYCDQQQLTIEQRLRLFESVAEAVAYAHRNLVVHRDLKPSNILVTADGQVKLLDFGIAKPLGGGTGDTALTRTAMQVLTPEYASPEQVRGGTITTASDIYALGILLYELLTGQRPYRFEHHTPGEIERVVCETEPLKPSAAAPMRLRRRLRGDLDTIVLKALRKEPERRYSSVAALLEDVGHHNDGRPVLARPDTAIYRGRKFVGRHRVGVAISGLIVALLVGLGTREAELRRRAEATAIAAEAATRRAEAVKDYLVGVFEASDPYGLANEPGENVSARVLLDRGAERVDAELASDPEVQAEMLAVLGRVYTNLGLHDRAAPLLQRSLAQLRSRHGGSHPAVAKGMVDLGGLYMVQGRFADAETLLRDALAMRRALFGNVHQATAESLDRLATLFHEQNDFAAAEPLLREALAARRHVLGPEHGEIAVSLNNLALLLWAKGEYDRAEPLYREALEIQRKTAGEEHPLRAETMHNLAQVQQFRGEIDEAELLFRRALAIKRKVHGNVHPSVTVNLNNLAELLRSERNDLEAAEPLVREALELDRQIFGEEHPYVAASLDHLATIVRMKGSFVEAERLYRQALAVNRRLLGDDHKSVALNLSNLAGALLLKGDFDAAEANYRESLRLYRKLLGEDHPYPATVSLHLARVLREKAANVEAESLYRDVIRRQEAKPGARVPFILAHTGLGRVLVARGNTTEALELLRRAVDMSKEQFGDTDWRTAEAQMALGSCLVLLRRYADAEPLLVKSRTALRTHRVAQPLLARQADAAVASLAAQR